jgi:hypothetical protein
MLFWYPPQMPLTSPKSSTGQNSPYAVILEGILDFYFIRFIWGCRTLSRMGITFFSA